MHTVIIVAVAGYLAALLVSLGALRPGAVEWGRWGRWVFDGALLAHSVSLVMLSLDARFFPPSGSADYLFWLAWCVAVALRVMRRWLQFPVVASMVSGMVSLLIVSSSYLAHQDVHTDVGVSGGELLFVFHVIPTLAAETALVFAVVVSAVFLIQERRLKRRVAAAISLRGPSLAGLAKLNTVLMSVGFLSMTGAVLSGVVWSVVHGAPLLAADALQWTALLSWMVLGGVLNAILTLRWPARRVAVCTVTSGMLFLSSLLAALLWGGGALHVG